LDTKKVTKLDRGYEYDSEWVIYTDGLLSHLLKPFME